MKTELQQIRQDLDTMRDAVGLSDPPMGYLDVWGLALLGITGFGFALASWLTGGIPWVQLTLPSFILFLIIVIGNHYLYTRRVVRTPARDRSYNYSWLLGLAIGVVLGGFYIWAKFFASITGPNLLGLSCFLVGTMFFFLAISSRWARFFLGFAFPFFIFGFAVTVLPSPWIQPALGLTLGISGFASALILLRHLRSTRGAAL